MQTQLLTFVRQGQHNMVQLLAMLELVFHRMHYAFVCSLMKTCTCSCNRMCGEVHVSPTSRQQGIVCQKTVQVCVVYLCD